MTDLGSSYKVTKTVILSKKVKVFLCISSFSSTFTHEKVINIFCKKQIFSKNEKDINHCYISNHFNGHC